MNLRDFADEIDNGDLCDLGYKLRELDWRVYCYWVCDCAEHVLPLTHSLVATDEVTLLNNALETARGFASGTITQEEFANAVARTEAIHRRVMTTPGRIDAAAAEALESVFYAVKQANPESRIYHEDVIYAAARAAHSGAMHDNDSVDPILESDCYDESELEGSQESHKEQAWQLKAMLRRVAEAT